MAPSVGEIYLHNDFYPDAKGNLQRKYLVILGIAASGDIVFRLLTTAGTDRPITGCSHAPPYAGHYVNNIGGQMPKPTWVDLRAGDDYDLRDFRANLKAAKINAHGTMPRDLLCAVLDCAARAPDTTRDQSNSMRNARSTIGC